MIIWGEKWSMIFPIKYWVWKLVVYNQWFVSIFNFCNDCYHKTFQRWSSLFRWWNWSKSVISLKSTDLYSYSEWNFCGKELDKRYWNQFFWTSFNIFCDKELQKIPKTKFWILWWQRKMVINKILEYLSVACVLPRDGQMRRRIIRADGSLFRFFTKNQTSYEIISFAFWPKGAYDDVWSWHFACRNNGPKKVDFCGSLDNCPWVRVTL